MDPSLEFHSYQGSLGIGQKHTGDVQCGNGLQVSDVEDLSSENFSFDVTEPYDADELRDWVVATWTGDLTRGWEIGGQPDFPEGEDDRVRFAPWKANMHEQEKPTER